MGGGIGVEGGGRRGEEGGRGWEGGRKVGIEGGEGINVLISVNIWNTYTGQRRKTRDHRRRGSERKLQRGVLGRRWMERRQRRVRSSLLSLILSLLTPLYQPSRCKSDCQMDPGELCHCTTMNSTSIYSYVSFPNCSATR